MTLLVNFTRKFRLLSQLLTFILLISSLQVFAEGSKDINKKPGKRLFLYAYDPLFAQQLKVFAKQGEFINVGASHVGLKGGFIKVYAPSGALVATFDDANGPGIINNNVEEDGGPTGGGTLMGTGYKPGVVPATEEGVYSVHISYPDFVYSLDFKAFNNLDVGQPWTRAADQPATIRRVVLAWDITISQNAAGNETGSTLLKGRVFSQDLNCIINNNGNNASPSFYIQTKDGVLYQIDFTNVDPWGFPLVSNNVGLTNDKRQPLYKSLANANYKRTANLSEMVAGGNYLYEPQARDTMEFINNKIFINPPSDDLPTTALVTDIFRNDTYSTWLKNAEPEGIANFSKLELHSLNSNCDINTIEIEKGGNFVFTSNMSGTGLLSLDLNNDGDFTDPEDVNLVVLINKGDNKIFWDGKLGNGNYVNLSSKFDFNYKFSLRSGEIHVMMNDIENNPGGTLITRLNGPEAPESIIYYDHSSIGGGVSGGGTAGNPQSTNTPYTYMGNFGNDKMLDYWAYLGSSQKILDKLTITVAKDCSAAPIDTDKDGIPDVVDLDDDNDGVSDVQEFCNLGKKFTCLPNSSDPSADDDLDRIPNYKDAFNGTTNVGSGCIDANNDGICDVILAIYDTDGDNIPDHLDLDSDNDGITDLDEAGHNQPDVDRNGVIDGLPIVFGKNGLYDPIDIDTSSLTAGSKIIPWDTDGDGIPDHDDLDSDNDGIFDLREADYGYEIVDKNNDGRIDISTSLPVDANGLAIIISPTNTNQPIGYPKDFDNDGIPDWHDLDSDNDGINDVAEASLPDEDNDGIIGTGKLKVNGDGVATADAKGNPLGSTNNPTDTDNDGIPDWHDADSDNDGIPDVIEAGFADPDKDGQVGTGKPVVNPFGQPKDNFKSITPDYDKDGIPDFRDIQCNLTLDKPALNNIDAVCPNANIELIAQSNYLGAQFIWLNKNSDTLSKTAINKLVINAKDVKAISPFSVYITYNGCKSNVSDPLEVKIKSLPAGAQMTAVNDTFRVATNRILSNSVVPNDLISNVKWKAALVTAPTKGNLTLNPNGTFSYVPNANYNGNDQFTYKLEFEECPEINSVAVAKIGVIKYSIDTDKDGITDDVDLDDDNDGVSDVQEFCNLGKGFSCLPSGLDPSGDEDLDGIPNYKDAINDYNGSLQGCVDGNNDGICDIINASYDTDGDNIPDHLDLDSDNDGITDLDEAGHNQPDLDRNGVIDGAPSAFGINGLYDPIDKDVNSLTAGSKITPIDTDGDSVPDHDDLDSDNDGIYDLREADYGYELADLNNDGRIDVNGTNPVDANGLPSIISPALNGNKPIGYPKDYDGDGVPDWHDLDSDNDGINDVAEASLPDDDNDGIIGTGKPKVNGDGVATADSKGNPLTATNKPTDTDGDGIPDWHDADSDNDGIKDVIEAGFSDPDNDGQVGTGKPIVNPFGQPKEGNKSKTPDFDKDGIPDFRDTECNLVLDKPTLTNSEDVCPNSDIILYAQSNYPSTNFVWYNASGDTLSKNSKSLVINVNNTKAISPYFVQIFYNGCKSTLSDPLQVKLKAIPLNADFNAVNDSYRVAINGSLTSNVTLNDAYSNAFNWIVAVATAPQNGTVTISTNGEFTYKPNNGYKGADKFTYKLAYADCPDIFKTAEVVLDVNNDNVDDCNIPNIITPNDDDENDVLIIPCADSYPESELTVYNRWGSVVYNERNYKNKWKGTYNGDLLPAGTYYYTYKLKPSDSKCKVGYVTIVRD